ncbi:MAG: hemerythrin domain-containing protein [Myxococcales bacterium]|nr:hemerythrin domain-containing protein [Myxococcales bacterium]
MNEEDRSRPVSQPGLRTRMGQESRRISSQHRQLDTLYGLIVAALRGGERDRAERALQRFGDAFDAHISLEDGFYFPALRGMQAHVGAELDGLSEEHERFRRDLEALNAEIRVDSLDAVEVSLDDFITRVAAHEGREEALLASLTQRGD